MSTIPPNSSSTRKKVVVRQLDGGLVKGYVDSASFQSSEGAEVLDREGHLVTIRLDGIKGIYFVRDFEGDPNRQERKVFNTRPRVSGIWVRLTFKDNEIMEGLLANNLLEVEPQGFMITPPDFYANNLRIFVPRNALGIVEVLGVITEESARKAAQRAKRPPKKPAAESPQISLFPPAE
ncbi:MAG: hypothetical protein HY508_02330 [Acidobacteria bacterium]|nr:hypothetical protein [Acidobacteriota bacterium]